MAFRLFALVVMLCFSAVGQSHEEPAGERPPEAPAGEKQRNAIVAPVVPADVPYRPLTAEERWSYYFRHTYVSPAAYLRAASTGLTEQWKGEPPSWEQGMSGFGRRTGSAWARFTLTDTYEAAGAAALGHEIRYVRCRCSGFGRRFGYAVAASLLTRDSDGRLVPAAARIGGQFGAGYTARLWLPEDYQSNSRIARSVLFQTGFQGLVNTVREFTPELKRLLRRK